MGQLVADALEHGDSLGQIQKALRADFVFSPARARMVARTETATALGQGTKEASIAQGRDQKHWVTQGDDVVSLDCLDNEDAGWIKVADLFPSGRDTIPQHPNCLLPGNRVIAPLTIAGSRAFYDGDAIELTTEYGNRLTITPNHMILTPSGFVKAKFLREGDHIISSLDAQRIGACIDPDNDHIPTPIEQVWDSLMMAPGVASRVVPSTPIDFNGDARGFQSDVHIISSDSLLRNLGMDVSILQHVSKGTLYFRDTPPFKLSNSSSLFQLRNARFASYNSLMSGGSQYLSFGNGQTSHPAEVGLASISGDNASNEKVAADNIPAYTQLARQFQFRFASLITGSQIIKIRKFNFSGHVYDLQTSEQLYIANNIIVKNCRCLVRFRTSALHEQEAIGTGRNIPSPDKGFRCQTCNKLLATSPVVGVLYWCARCKTNRTVGNSAGSKQPKVLVQRVKKIVERDEAGRITTIVEETMNG